MKVFNFTTLAALFSVILVRSKKRKTNYLISVKPKTGNSFYC